METSHSKWLERICSPFKMVGEGVVGLVVGVCVVGRAVGVNDGFEVVGSKEGEFVGK